MKRVICFLLNLAFVFFVKAQTTLPIGVPTQKINGWIENYYTVPDSGAVIPRRDTAWRPRFIGMSVTWPRPGVDTVQWFWNGAKWGKFSPNAPGDSSFVYVDYVPQDVEPSYSEGRLFYDNTNETLALFNGVAGTPLHIGQEQCVRARNNTGSQINAGSVVYISGATGQTPTIALARSDVALTGRAIGMALHNISNNTTGKVITFGSISNINTSSFSAGDKLYLSPTTAGALTNVQPDVPNFPVFIGYCLNSHVNQGKVLVSVQNTLISVFQLTDTSFIARIDGVSDTIRISRGTGGGSVTSVGLSMPSAFTVTGSPITGAGTFAVSGAGTTLQYIRGNGTLATFDTTAIPNFYIKVQSLIAPPGSNAQIIYNNSGAYGASPDFKWNDVTKKLSVIGALGEANSEVSVFGDGSIDVLTVDDNAAPSVSLINNASSELTMTMFGTSVGNLARISTNATDMVLGSAKGTFMPVTDSVNIEGIPKATADSVWAVGTYNSTHQTNSMYKVSQTSLYPTWQQALTKGSVLTSNNVITGGNFSWTWNNNLSSGATVVNKIDYANSVVDLTVTQSPTTYNFNIDPDISTALTISVADADITNILDLTSGQGGALRSVGHVNESRATLDTSFAIVQSGTIGDDYHEVSVFKDSIVIDGKINNGIQTGNTFLSIKGLPQSSATTDSVLVRNATGRVFTRAQSAIAALATLETALTASPNITTDHTTAIGSNRWQINGGDPSDYLLGVNNSTGGGIDIISANGNAVLATTTTSTGISINGLTLNGTAFNFTQLHSTSTNDITVLGTFTKGNISQTPAAGFGLANDYYLSSAAGTSRQAGREAFKWTTATDASRTSMFELSTVNSGTLARKLAISGAGQATLDSYTGTTFQTTDTSYNALVVDASGNVYKRAGDANLTASGLYTPTVTGVLNVDATTAHQCRYTRVGNIVFVGGVVEIDPTAASATAATITLPISSTFTTSDDINGVVSVNELTTPNAHITRSGNVAFLSFTSGTTSNFALYFTFSYEVK